MNIEAMELNELSPEDDSVVVTNNASKHEINWSDVAPRGGKAVLNRILRDGAKVPLFFGQTLVNSLRDLGYNTTTSALCEHVDNAIQWGADEIRVYFSQPNSRGGGKTSILVYDNGQGMAPHVLKVATAFGGSMVFGNRADIGRYGMGMKTAALSMAPTFEIHSWQEPQAFYSMAVDVEEIGSSRSNLIELPDPVLSDSLSNEILDILVRPMRFPKNPDETQNLLGNRDNIYGILGKSGTIVFMPECDRLTYKKEQTLADHATKEMGRIYRQFIAKGVKIFVNNRLVEASDPTYWMESARHTRIDGLVPNQSRLINSFTIQIPVAEDAQETAPAVAKLYLLPYEQWSTLPRKTLNNDLHLFDGNTVSFLRNGREVEAGPTYSKINIRKHSDFNWIRLEIDFPGELDEGFGVAANKQGVRLKQYVADRILSAIGQEVKNVRDIVKRQQAEANAQKVSRIGEAERRATEAETFQGKPLPSLTEEEEASVDIGLRALATTIRRDDESEDQAYARLKSSDFVTIFKHDSYWPFYHCDFKFGKVITTVNTAHPFFEKVWQPLTELSALASVEDSEDGDVPVNNDLVKMTSEVLIGVQTMLLSLARTQSQLSNRKGDDDYARLFRTLQQEWSASLATQLRAK